MNTRAGTKSATSSAKSTSSRDASCDTTHRRSSNGIPQQAAANRVAPRNEAMPHRGQSTLDQLTSSCEAEKGKPGRRLRSSACLHVWSNVCTPSAAYSGQKTGSQAPWASCSRWSSCSLKSADSPACASALTCPSRALSEAPPTVRLSAKTDERTTAASAAQAGAKTTGQDGPTPGAPVSSEDRLAATSGPPSTSSNACHFARSSDAKHRCPTTDRAAGATSQAACRAPGGTPRSMLLLPPAARVSMLPRARAAAGGVWARPACENNLL
eukprot:scaffold25647_cov112-Isochrysis_galbana.AAC.1